MIFIKTIFENSRRTNSYNKLNKNKSYDIVIIGGGLNGLLLAHKLSKTKKSIAVLDKNIIGNMSSLYNTGKCCFLQNDLFYLKEDELLEHLKNSYLAIMNLKNIILSENIDCDYKETVSHLFSTSCDDLTKISDALDLLKIKNKYNNSIIFDNLSNITVYDEFTFNPYKFIQNLTKNFDIYEHTRVTKIRENNHEVITEDDFKIKYNKLIICSNFPFMKFKNFFGFRLYSEKSYLIAFETDKLIYNSYTQLEDKGISLRKYNDLNIICGMDHKTGYTDNSPYHQLIKFLTEHINNYKVIHKWFNIDTITFDKLPLIGYLNDDIYISTGFNKWGISNSSLSSLILNDMITNNIKNNKDNIYNPHRSFFIKHPIKMSSHILSSSFNLFLSLFSNKRCNHLGCKLKYNFYTNTYDCPCHGSVFKNDKIIFGPGHDKK